MFRVSTREMLVLVAAIAVAIVSMWYASSLWQAVVGLIVLAVTIMAVISAIFDLGPRQVFAIGMVVVMLGYSLLILNGKKYPTGAPQMPGPSANGEFDSRAQVPTSQLLHWLRNKLDRSGYVDSVTGKTLAADDPEIPTIAPGSNGELQTSSGRQVYAVQLPPMEDFMFTGDFWWALLFGYLGGRYAQFVYTRRIKERPTAA